MMPKADKTDNKYWSERFKNIEEVSHEKADRCIKEASKIIDDAIVKIDKDIRYWVERFAKNNNMTYAEAVKAMTAKDFEELGWDVEKYIAKMEEDVIKYGDKLENASSNYHISRLDAIKQQLQYYNDAAFNSVLTAVSTTAADAFTEAYYSTGYTVQKMKGKFDPFAALDTKRLGMVLSEPWAEDGMEFSERIWGAYRNKLAGSLKKSLTQWCIQGTSYDKLAEQLKKDSGVAKNACKTLISTEIAHLCTRAEMEGYKETKVKQYEVLESLDGVTCSRCGGMDGKKFNVDDFDVGVTAPPFHPNCRGTTVPVVRFDSETRAARNPETGKTEYVENMTYTEWKKKYVEDKGQQAWDYYEKSSKYKEYDKKQLKRYKEVLGKNAPKNLDEFQKIKYNDNEKWNILKYNYRVVNSYEDNLGSMDKMKIVELDDFAFKIKTHGFTGKAKNKANIAVMEMDGKIKIANSQLDKLNDPAFVNFKYDEVNKILANTNMGKITTDNLVLKKETPEFKTFEVGSHSREMDSEAKLFEYAADVAKDGKQHTINILSEKCMCDSCLGVMEQFKNKYPNVRVNAVSNRKSRNEINKGKPWKNRR